MNWWGSVFIAVWLVASVVGAPFRLPGSPYPAPSQGPNSTTTLYPFSDSSLTPTQLLTLQSLQGLIARTSPLLFRLSDSQQLVWLSDLSLNFNVYVNLSLNSSFTKILQEFRTRVTGYVLCDSTNGDNVNVALSISAASSAKNGWNIVVDVQDQSTVASSLSPPLPLSFDARSISYSSLFSNYTFGVDYSNRIATLQDPTKFEFLSDYSPFASAVTWFDTDPNLGSSTSKTVLGALQPNSAVFGWGVAEGNTVDILAGVSSYIHASDWAPNLATLTGFHVENFAQKRTTSTTTKKSQAASKHTVCFLMTDGDNVQWLVTGFASPSNDWYGSSNRGKVPLGWTVSPGLVELAPSILQWFYRNATGMDNFVAGPSGVGYTIPEHFPSSTLTGFTNLTTSFTSRADLRIVNVINDDGSLPNLYPFLENSSGGTNGNGLDAVFDYFQDCYCGGKGNISWYNNKPIIAGRYALWGDPSPGSCQNNENSLAKLLRELPKDPRNPQGYSLVPVHVWTHNVTSVVTMSQLLGSDYFDIVTPEEFVSRINSNIFHDCASAVPATGSFQSSCTKCTDSCGSLQSCSCDDGHGGTLITGFFDHTVCANNRVSNCFGRLICEGDSCTCPGPATGSFSGSCTGCRDVCGVLSGCKCTQDNGSGYTNANFDYSVCSNYAVANCDGVLLCQGQPC